MGTVRVTVNLPEELVEYLKNSAQRDHTNVTEKLKQAINTERYFDEQERKGTKILIENDGKVREVVRR